MSHFTKDYAYAYPEDLVALFPTENRAESRLFVLDRNTTAVEHKRFRDITDYFEAGQVLVINTSKVFPCRLITKRISGGRQEILLLRKISSEKISTSSQEIWQVLINASRKVKAQDTFEWDGLKLTILDEDSNERKALLEFQGELLDVLSGIADMPLPPYIRRQNEKLDRERYQTVFAKTIGSVAAPTAGLHFTPEILQRLRDKGVVIVEVTLHVGLGTFLPVKTDDIRSHNMHSEFFSISQESCDAINLAKKEKRLITAVGTTSVRVLETLAKNQVPLTPQNGSTDIFIYPPYEFKIVDRLITNFHQPESTLLMLVSAFAGRDKILSAYQTAIENKYRLFSYGDCMLIL